MKNKSASTILAVISLAASTAFAASAVETWNDVCAKCHGADGKGQTKVGKKLHVLDYSDGAVQAKLKDADLAKAIAYGVKEGDKERMPAYRAELTDAETAEVIKVIRAFGPPVSPPAPKSVPAPAAAKTASISAPVLVAAPAPTTPADGK